MWKIKNTTLTDPCIKESKRKLKSMLINKYFKNKYSGQVLVAYAYNPTYSGVRDQEDCRSKPALTNSSGNLISRKPIVKNCWWSGSRYRF
jgi:hypothetical protein